MRSFSYTQLSSFRRCRARYYFQYIKKIPTKPSLGLIRGGAGHAALANWYKNKDSKMAIETAWGKWHAGLSGAVEEYSKDWSLLELILNRYFDWATINDNFIAEQVEYKFVIELDGLPFMGYIDAVVKEGDTYWLLEHKFNKMASTKHLQLDSQIRVYTIAAIMRGWDIAGVIYNIIRVGDGPTAQKEPVLRTRVYCNTEGLETIKSETIMQMKEMDKFIKEGGIVYRNPTRDCSWDCGYYSTCLELNDSGKLIFPEGA